MKNINLKFFIVDDDKIITNSLKQIITSIGYANISIFYNGEDCIKHLNENPAIVFLDYNMEEMDGLATLKKIKELNAHTKVIFTTGVEDLSIAMKSVRQGSYDFLLKKNISKKEIENIINKIENDSIDSV